MRKAILVGSKPNKNWQGKLEKHLSTVGIEIVGVWRKPGDPARRGIFAGATSILLTNDCCSHTLQDAAKSEAKRANLPLIVINHRWSSCSQILAKHGITAEITAQSAEKAQGESMARGPKPKGPSRSEWKDILRPIVEKNPQIGPAAVAEWVENHGTNHYTRDAALRELRKELGWTWNNRAAAFVQADATEATKATVDCEKELERNLRGPAHLMEMELRAGRCFTPPQTKISRPSPDAGESHPGDMFPVSHAAAETPPAPEPTPTPYQPAEAPTEPATGLPEDVQAALTLLLAVMRQNGVEHIEMNNSGEASFRRHVITYIENTVKITQEEL